MIETIFILSSYLCCLRPLPSSVMPQTGSAGLALPLPLTCPQQVEVVAEVQVKHLWTAEPQQQQPCPILGSARLADPSRCFQMFQMRLGHQWTDASPSRSTGLAARSTRHSCSLNAFGLWITKRPGYCAFNMNYTLHGRKHWFLSKSTDLNNGVAYLYLQCRYSCLCPWV